MHEVGHSCFLRDSVEFVVQKTNVEKKASHLVEQVRATLCKAGLGVQRVGTKILVLVAASGIS